MLHVYRPYDLVPKLLSQNISGKPCW